MAAINERLIDAIVKWDVGGVMACLAAGADANARTHGRTPLHIAAHCAATKCAAELLAAGADPNASAASDGETPLHYAAFSDSPECVALLLAAGADPLAASCRLGCTPVHYARIHSILPLLQAAPSLALAKTTNGFSPLDVALSMRRLEAARCLLEEGLLPPPDDVLASLSVYLNHLADNTHPLYAVLIARQHKPLTAEQWARVPSPCAGLVAVLPVVLERSVEEAGMLVRRLALEDRQRLRAATLCLARVQRQAGAELPSAIMWRVLALAAI